ncbi:hypothetical protein Micbo1qcDRAFT_190081 [Microdochium bolleyi]|uniref:Hemerythrin-like domain-containing protein n=1 Tax=Microdochium bolleyi TaxID=196109 RepID=A0A136ITW9_9PEZI|nr:hypothetical protein Micbo1qcDRAFT_190081 [Microdochium bolleyi]
MTARPSEATWADEPFALIPTPSQRIKDDHSYVFVASEMAHVHNTLIRGLNAILLQGPHVPDASDPKDYNQTDVQDLLYYVRCWCEMVNHHHDVEEAFIFPELEKFSGQPGLMEDPRHQHSLFHDGMERLLAYATATTPAEYRWLGDSGMKHIIDSFSKALTDHLYAEIEVLLKLGHLDSEGLKKTWIKAEDIAKAKGGLSLLYTVFPCVLGCADKTYEGGNDFPPLPWIMPYLVKYWFARGVGAWRFNPCDFFGQPRPLCFGPHSGEYTGP